MGHPLVVRRARCCSGPCWPRTGRRSYRRGGLLHHTTPDSARRRWPMVTPRHRVCDDATATTAPATATSARTATAPPRSRRGARRPPPAARGRRTSHPREMTPDATVCSRAGRADPYRLVRFALGENAISTAPPPSERRGVVNLPQGGCRPRTWTRGLRSARRSRTARPSCDRARRDRHAAAGPQTPFFSDTSVQVSGRQRLRKTRPRLGRILEVRRRARQRKPQAAQTVSATSEGSSGAGSSPASCRSPGADPDDPLLPQPVHPRVLASADPVLCGRRSRCVEASLLSLTLAGGTGISSHRRDVDSYFGGLGG